MFSAEVVRFVVVKETTNMPALFERPIPPGWVYACTLEQIERQLATFPAEDLEGLHAAGLVPATRKDNNTYGLYSYRSKPVIHLYSGPASGTDRLRSGSRRDHAVSASRVEMGFGLRIREEEGRVYRLWEPEDLARFMLEFVLAHEVGHHVMHRQRLQQGWKPCPATRVCEQFADAYAMRYVRSLQEVNCTR
jgi:hypothetical protein